MRIVIAQMKHETNTFSPVPTPLERFAHGRKYPAEGREAIYRAGRTGGGGNRLPHRGAGGPQRTGAR